MVIVTGRPVAVPPVPMLTVTPLPLNVTAVAPVRFRPLIFEGTVVPAVPEGGVMPVITGNVPPVGCCTVKPVNGADVPAAVVTVKLRVSNVALVVIVMLTDRPAVPAVPTIAVTPVPLKSTLVAPVRSVPLIRAGRVVPKVPDDGLMPVMFGSGMDADCSAML